MESRKVSTGALVAVSVLSVLPVLFWIIVVTTLADLAGSDAAGNAYAQACGAIEVILLWLLLAVITLIAGVVGSMPVPAVFAAFFLIPASGVAAMAAHGLLSHPQDPPHLLPLVIPAAAPLLILAFAFWSLLPPLRRIIPAWLASGVAWGGVLLLCVAVFPLQQVRNKAVEEFMAAREKWAADFAKLPADAPLWDWVPFLNTPDETRVEKALVGLRKLERRQGDAETMLERGDFPIGFLGRMDLMPSTPLCDKARAFLRKQVEPLLLKTPNSKPYLDVFWPVNLALADMRWLVGHDCSCDAEAQAWQTMAEGYRDPGYALVELRQLRDPKELGRQQREYPERFSMLTPQSHLKAWLRFAAADEAHDAALDGARKLAHRNDDAIEMLTDKYDMSAPWQVLRYLPELDLDTNPRLCTAALNQVARDIAKVYRPKPDDPRSYDELLSRLGTDKPLTALAWLAGHGCEAEPELSEAEEVVRAYQDSPQRAAMLAILERLHRK